jgi:hypothetical protein
LHDEGRIRQDVDDAFVTRSASFGRVPALDQHKVPGIACSDGKARVDRAARLVVEADRPDLTRARDRVIDIGERAAASEEALLAVVAEVD